MQKFNYHTHTYRCGHAEATSDEEIVKAFIRSGFKKVAFTDHAPEKELIDKRVDMRMDYLEKNNYLKSIWRLKEKYSKLIEIESGFEIEYLPDQEENILELKNEVDKLILGQHFVYGADKTLKIFGDNEMTDEDIRNYAFYIMSAISKGIPDIIAHPDIYIKDGENLTDLEVVAAHEICALAEKYGVPLEINLKPLYEYFLGKRESVSYPSKRFWQIATEYPNLKVLFGIDVHSVKQIELYEQILELAEHHLGTEVLGKLNFCNELLKNEQVNRRRTNNSNK